MSANVFSKWLAAVALWLAVLACTPALAAPKPAPLTLAEVSAAAEHQDLAVLRRALDDPRLFADLAALDPQAVVDLQLSIAAAFDHAGDARGAIAAYEKAVASIAAAHGGHDDLAEVEPLRRVADLKRGLGDLAGAVDAVDRAYAIAVTGKHPSLRELKVQYADVRAAYLAAHPGATLPEDYHPRGGSEIGGYDVVEVFYATHRKPTGATEPDKFFGGERGPLVYGRAMVSVPRDRPAGSLPKPSIWRAEFRPDPNKHIILTDVKPIDTRDGFFGAVSDRVGKSSRKEVFVFIHGFNTSFEGAAERAGQIAADLSLDGAPILYSWPSKGSVLAYKADEQEPEVDAQIADLADFLADVAARSGADHVNLVAHSMGNRFLMKALNRLAERPVEQRPKFNEVVLAAPDVGVDDFNRRWAQVRQMGTRYTLYASKRDKALLISGQIHDMQRIGDAHKVVTAEGLQTIDTTAASGGLLGHTDFAGTALDDFRGLIWYSLTPDKRCVLQTDRAGGSTFWVFAAPGACPESEFREAVSLARTEGSPTAAAQRVQTMISQMQANPGAGADLSLLRNVERLLLAFPTAAVSAAGTAAGTVVNPGR